MIEARLRELKELLAQAKKHKAESKDNEESIADLVYIAWKTEELIQAIEQSRVGEVEWRKLGLSSTPYFTRDEGKCMSDLLNQQGTLYFSPEVKP